MITQIRGGINVRVRQIGSRAVVEGVNFQSLDHPWRCLEVGGEGVEVRQGLVNGLEPFIEGRAMSGLRADGQLDPLGPPVLPWRKDGPWPYWICVRVVVDEKGNFPASRLSPATLSVVTSPSLLSGSPEIGLHPVAQVRLPGQTLYQIGKFDYQHYTTGAGKKRRHHFAIA